MRKSNLIAPENFTDGQMNYIEKIKSAIQILPQTPDLKIFMKDINSRIMFAPDTLAIALGAKLGKDLEGKLASEVPCESVAASADQFRIQEKELLSSSDVKNNMSVLNVFNYSYGWQATVTQKSVLYHQESDSILGTIHQATALEVRNFVNIIPNYILRFGALGSFELNGKKSNIKDVHLTEYEEEICFLLLLNWSFEQIAGFMNTFRPNSIPRKANTIVKVKNNICNKFMLPLANKETLCEFLFVAGFHKKLPSSFYKNMLGSSIIE